MKKFLILILSVVLLLVIFPLTFGWLSLQTRIDLPLTGGIFTNYFHSGNGSEQNPYTITKPQHLYNLTMLYQELEDFDEEGMYFELSNSIDCSGIENFLPIGTISHPFRGNFNGNDFTIDNLTIIGSGESDVGFFGYVDDCAAISNVYIEDLVISIDDCSTAASSVTVDHTAHSTSICYVGYIAGHIANATCFENVYVNNCEITGTASNFESKWGYFGYCENAGTIDDFIAHVGAEDPGWGGSVNMKNMYNRLYDIAGDATTNSSYAFEKDIVTRPNGETFERNALTGYAYTYRSQKEGSFVFSRYSSNAGPLSNFMYLNGGTRYHPYSQTETQVSGGQAISYNGHYLGVSGTSIADHQDGWQYSNNILSIAIDGITYYLTHNLTLSTITQEEWTKNGNRLYYTSGGIFGLGSTYHYITYDNGWVVKETTRRNNATQLIWTNTTYTRITESSSGSEYMDYSGTNVTYFPLITGEDNYEVAGKNTGYVIGGSEDNTTSAYPDKTGDIRVSKYSTSDISNSYSNGTLTNVYTVSASNQTVAINLSDYTKYLESMAEFLDMINDGNIYGLHFMPANISINHLVSADYALINGVEKTNYQMPASSIDFNLLEKGYINFFAGTYFSGNNSFFSLHHIERDNNNEIISIKEISEIYESSDERKDYIYKYSDGSYTDTLTSDYSLAFSTNRIKIRANNSNWKDDAVYYFEIPVNLGEYALGSVDGGIGAYLMYLDIGSNGGVDFNAKVDTFGSVEYRSATDTVESSILLLTFKQLSEVDISIKVYYNKLNNSYYITTNSAITVTVTILNEDYNYSYNNQAIPSQIGSYNKT